MRRVALMAAGLTLACGHGLVRSTVAGPPAERIVFFGDSLVHRSEKDHGLLSALQARLARRYPQRRFELVDKGRNGNRIADLRSRVEGDVIELRPALVVLFWDSDCSDVDERGHTTAEVDRLRSDYERDLTDVVSRLKQAGADVLVSGPALIGEGVRGANARDTELDAYVEINRRVAAARGVRYLDARSSFLAWLHRHADQTRRGRLLLTEDGEHLNARGTALLARRFLVELERWVGRH
jgi:lysophospholipase L1-like esterase